MMIDEKLEKKLENNRALADSIMQRFRDAVLAKQGASDHYEKGLTHEIKLCHLARRGMLDDDEKGVADELAHVGLEFGKRKALAAADIINDLIRNSIDMPILEPTPIPELPADVKAQILEKMKAEIFVNEFSGDLRELAARLRVEATGTQMDRAKAAAAKAEIAIRDKLSETDFRQVMQELVDDFVSMPFAVLKYPHYTMVDDPKWVGNKWVIKREMRAVAKRVDPKDFFVLNGKSVADAEAVFEVDATTLFGLKQMSGKSGWVSDAITAVYDRGPSTGLTTSQAIVMGASTTQEIIQARSSESDTKELVWFYGRMRGEDIGRIRGMADKTVQKDEYYEVCAVLCDKYVVYLNLLEANTAKLRPYKVSSYEKLNGTWSGIGVLQRVRKAEKLARAFMFAGVRNAAYSARPTGEIDYERLRNYYPDQDKLNEFLAGHMYVTDPDRTGIKGGSTAVHFHNVPNYSAQLLNGVTFFLDLVDLLAAVPKLGTGDMRGMATLGRSYRGIALVQQAEAKTMRAALDHFDQDFQEPMLLDMYYNLQEFSKDSSVKGDARIIPRSTSGYLRKEANAAARQETVQAVIGLANATTQDGAPLVDSDLMKSLVLEMFKDQGVDVDRFYGPDGNPLSTTGATDTGNPVPTAPGFGGQQVPV